MRVRKEFTAALRRKLPMFNQNKSAKLSPGSCLYDWPAAPDLIFYVFLCFSPRTNSTLSWHGRSLGLSDNETPRHSAATFPSRRHPPRRAPRWRVPDPLSGLWQTRDSWWDLAPEPTLEQLQHDSIRSFTAWTRTKFPSMRRWSRSSPSLTTRPIASCSMGCPISAKLHGALA